jgi:hypothetical protein
MEDGLMPQTKVTFHNQAPIKVQAQIFAGYTLISTCVAGPGESRVLMAESAPYDIFLKDGATGWEIARRLEGAATSITLSQRGGRYVIT